MAGASRWNPIPARAPLFAFDFRDSGCRPWRIEPRLRDLRRSHLMDEATRKRVLVVDDEPDVRDYLQAALEDAGFLVVTAGNGLEALDAIRRQPPDLISLDLVMPHHSG